MNTNKIIITILTIILIIVCLFNCKVVNDLEEKTEELIELTNIEPEIIFIDSLVHDTTYITKTEVVRLPIYHTDTILTTDTILVTDSVDVVIPINTYHYDTTLNETTISLICEGFDVRLNSLLIENFLSVPTQEKAVKKWYEDIHLGAGLSVTYIDKFRFVPTLGIYYNIFNF